MNPKYKRIVLKLSGEALKDVTNGEPLDPAILKNLALSLKEIHSLGVQICLVVVGGKPDGNVRRRQVKSRFPSDDRRW